MKLYKKNPKGAENKYNSVNFDQEKNKKKTKQKTKQKKKKTNKQKKGFKPALEIVMPTERLFFFSSLNFNLSQKDRLGWGQVGSS